VVAIWQSVNVSSGTSATALSSIAPLLSAVLHLNVATMFQFTLLRLCWNNKKPDHERSPFQKVDFKRYSKHWSDVSKVCCQAFVAAAL
jgi:hypothetical protein